MKIDYNESPLLAVWETTRSCAVACSHCRTEAILARDSAELSTEEGKRLLADIAAMDTPIFTLSGGDCLNRRDIEALVEHGKSIGLHMAATPAATANITEARLRSLKAAGLDQLGFSLDAPNAAAHDTFRKVDGSFNMSMAGLRLSRELGLPVQLNTCVAEWNYRYLEQMIGLVNTLDIAFWEISFLVPWGLSGQERGISAQEFEDAFERLCALKLEAPYYVKLTEAPHFKRFLMEKELAGGASPKPNRGPGIREEVETPGIVPNAGKGCIFVDHVGNICPSALLPLASGNVRTNPIADIYRNAHPFRELRDHKLLKGRCGVCEYADVCSGSRARAWAVTGDFLETDPFCAYIPKAMRAAPCGQGASGPAAEKP
ncbi:MAG: radical SAM protein [Elusimicrobia bacterium]|nr:radical SAM protein [Elusimicrobiota bacterium]